MGALRCRCLEVLDCVARTRQQWRLHQTRSLSTHLSISTSSYKDNPQTPQRSLVAVVRLARVGPRSQGMADCEMISLARSTTMRSPCYPRTTPNSNQVEIDATTSCYCCSSRRPSSLLVVNVQRRRRCHLDGLNVVDLAKRR